MKVCIAGVGKVGAAVGFAAVMRDVAEELLLLNRTAATAEGEALDLSHAGALSHAPPEVRAGKAEDSAGSDIIVLSASVALPRDLTSRLEMARSNCTLLDELVPPLLDASPEAIWIVVTNPVDVMATHLWRLGVEARRVLGTGTLIDSARYRSLLSKEVEIHPDDVRAYILGEHGDSQFPALSLAQSGGEWVGGGEAARRLFEEARGLGYEVLRRKGHTNYAIALAVGVLMESVREDARRTFPVSTPVDGFLGVDDVAISIPAVIGRAGIVRQLHPTLDPKEKAAFRASAQVVREAYRQVLD